MTQTIKACGFFPWGFFCCCYCFLCFDMWMMTGIPLFESSILKSAFSACSNPSFISHNASNAGSKSKNLLEAIT